ncbi:glutamine--tRNA ligase, partial [Vibrio parahaemolyticus AQ3810]
TCVNP